MSRRLPSLGGPGREQLDLSTVKSVPEDVAAFDPFTEASLEECLAHHDALDLPGIDRTAQLMLALSRVHLILDKGSSDQALEHLKEVGVDYVDILGAASRPDFCTSKARPGSPEARLPRYRIDRAVAREQALQIDPKLVQARRILFDVEVAERLRALTARGGPGTDPS